MSLICSLSNETPETPVISPVSGHVYEKRLILKFIEENGCDPVTGDPLAADALIAIKASPFVLPKPPSATSIPAILKALQDEWDAVMLQSFTLRQHLQTARQELSHALYQHDAACRVIARLTKEVSAAREALATLKPQAGVQISGQGEMSSLKSGQDSQEKTTENNLQPEIGLSDELKAQLQEASVRLTAERKKRGKNLPDGLATPEEISDYIQIASQTGLHSSSMPGVLCLDICRAWPERIITGGNDKNATIFNVSTSQVVSMLSGHTKKVTHVAYHPNEQIAFTGSSDCTVRVWGADQGQCASMLRSHKSAISGLSVHTSGDFILTSSYDGTWAFNDIRRGQVLVRVNGSDASTADGQGQNLTCAQCHPDGIILGTGTTDGEIKIWDLKQKRNVANFSHGAKQQDVRCISFSENGYFLASCGSDGQIKLWDLRRLKNFKTICPSEENPEAYEIGSIEFDQTGTYLGVCGSDARIYVVKTWDQIKVFDEHTASVTAIKFGKLANTILTSSLDRSVKIYSKQPMDD